MRTSHSKLYCFFILMGACSFAQAQANQGMQTFSPYSTEQLQEFNNQVISPVEGPMGPVAPNAQEMDLSKKPNLDSKFYNNPEGEDEAEALETQSADPYQPMSPVLTF